MGKQFQDKVIVITGAGGTLCSEIAIRLAEEGAKVVLAGRTEEKLKKVADKIAAQGGYAKIYACDDTSASRAAAAKAPVISLPPRLKVRIRPSGMAP